MWFLIGKHLFHDGRNERFVNSQRRRATSFFLYSQLLLKLLKLHRFENLGIPVIDLTICKILLQNPNQLQIWAQMTFHFVFQAFVLPSRTDTCPVEWCLAVLASGVDFHAE